MTGWRLTGTVFWLTLLWVLLWGSFTVANIASGLLVAFAVLAVARLPRLRPARSEDTARINPVRCVWFGLYVLYKLVEANLLLAWEIITPQNDIHTGIIAVPLRTESDLAMMVVANVITLTPGTVTVDVVGSPPVLYVHVLHLDSLEEVRAELLRLEELSVKAFGSRKARGQLVERSAS